MTQAADIREFHAHVYFDAITRPTAERKVVASVDVLVRMDVLAPKDLEDWPSAACSTSNASSTAASRV